MTNDKTTDMIALSVAEHKAAAFAIRCEATAIGLRQLIELGARPDTDDGSVELAARVTAELLTDPEALLAVALTAAQSMEAVRRRLVACLQQDPARRVPDDDPLPVAAELVTGDLMQARSRLGDVAECPALAAVGFHRIGRIDAVGRRSLWLREETGAVELRAGREGDDARVRITADHPLYRDLASVLGAARFAAEWEDRRGHGLDESFALDRCPASVHRVQDDDGAEKP